jgi:hypothetical protein
VFVLQNRITEQKVKITKTKPVPNEHSSSTPVITGKMNKTKAGIKERSLSPLMTTKEVLTSPLRTSSFCVTAKARATHAANVKASRAAFLASGGARAPFTIVANEAHQCKHHTICPRGKCDSCECFECKTNQVSGKRQRFPSVLRE